MKRNVEEIPHEANVRRPSDEPVGGGAPPPDQAPQSGMSILRNVFLYMLLLPTLIMLLARYLIE
jgi:hypothetical protein